MSPFTDYSILNPAASLGGRTGVTEATVLVVDDDPSMHDILTVLGQQHGFSIQFAEDGLDGVRLAESSDIDLIILDLTLPGLTGFDVFWRLRAAGVGAPVALVSAGAAPVAVAFPL